MATSGKQVIVVPSEEELSVSDTVTCSYDGCNRVFKSPASRSMHIIRHHEGKPLATGEENGRNSDKVYYCPVPECCRSQGVNNKPFKRLGHVKQHYNLVHKDKMFECDKCNRKFGMRDAYRRHVKECGIIFSCQLCDMELKSRNALYQHCKRTHNESRQEQSTVNNIIISPLIIKAVLPIPKANKEMIEPSSDDYNPIPLTDEASLQSVELATQTEWTDYEFLTSDSSHDKDVQTNCLAQCEFGTQTMPLLSDSWSESYLHSNDITDIFDTETIDFGTQTMLTPPLTLTSHEELGIQTYNFTKDQSSQTQ